MQSIEIDSRVRLLSFNGTIKPSEEIEERENYWKLIGEAGTIMEKPKKTDKLSMQDRDRFLVKFDTKLDDFGVENHNPIKNTLWIWHGDLEAL